MEDKKYLDGEQLAKDLREYCEKEFPKIVCTTKYFEQERIRMELDKGQIKKATECCATRDCDNCPYTDNKEMCFQISEAPTVIKELLNRIEILESLNRVNDKVGEDYVALHASYTELTRTCMTLTQKVKVLNEQYDALLDRNVELGDEVVGLKAHLDVSVAEQIRLADEVADWKAIAEQYQRQFEEARADTVREFAKRLKEHFPYEADSGFYVVLDQLAQEMLEEK